MRKILPLAALLLSCNCAPKRIPYVPEPKDPALPSDAVVRVVPTEPRAIEIRDIDPEGVVMAAMQFDDQVAAGMQTIWFQLNSNGGSIFAGLEFIKYIENQRKLHPLVKTICVVDFRAYSMAAVILESDVCSLRLMTTRSTLLFHNGSTQAKGTALDIAADAEFLAALDRGMAELVAGRMRMPVAKYQEMVKGHDWTLSWVDALAMNAIDGVLDQKDIPPVMVAVE